MRQLLLVVCSLLFFQLAARDSDYYKNVKSFRNGDIYITGIPQVNQKRNYCVPACVSMIVRYFDPRQCIGGVCARAAGSGLRCGL